ncbi:MAG: SRPBCC family protein [Gammaproteobacteria bacterium]
MAKWLLLFALAVGAGSVWAAELESITVSNESKRYFVRSVAMLDAPIDAVYDTLIDFDNYEAFSSVYDDARWLTRNEDDSGEIYTYTRGCILFVCRGFGRTETVVATKPTFIETRVDPARSKVRFGVSVWNIEAVDDKTKLEFALDFEPDFWVPPVVGPFVVKKYLRKGGVDALNRIEVLAKEKVGTDEPSEPDSQSPSPSQTPAHSPSQANSAYTHDQAGASTQTRARSLVKASADSLAQAPRAATPAQ